MTGTALTLLYLAGPRRWRRHRRGDSGGRSTNHEGHHGSCSTSPLPLALWLSG
jgi:hypothetical protein